jgi:hypothetical protein
VAIKKAGRIHSYLPSLWHQLQCTRDTERCQDRMSRPVSSYGPSSECGSCGCGDGTACHSSQDNPNFRVLRFLCACRPTVLVISLPVNLVRLGAFFRSISNALLGHWWRMPQFPLP